MAKSKTVGWIIASVTTTDAKKVEMCWSTFFKSEYQTEIVHPLWLLATCHFQFHYSSLFCKFVKRNSHRVQQPSSWAENVKVNLLTLASTDMLILPCAQSNNKLQQGQYFNYPLVVGVGYACGAHVHFSVCVNVVSSVHLEALSIPWVGATRWGAAPDLLFLLH